MTSTTALACAGACSAARGAHIDAGARDVLLAALRTLHAVPPESRVAGPGKALLSQLDAVRTGYPDAWRAAVDDFCAAHGVDTEDLPLGGMDEAAE